MDNIDEEIKMIVIEGYRKILKREPDPRGLENYIDEIKNGLSIEKFYEVLKKSEEYKDLSGKDILDHLSQFKSDINTTLAYCMIGANKLYEIKPYIETILPYIDRFIFIDGSPRGYSTDGTFEYLRSINNDDKIEIYTYEWQDDLSKVRNYYLKCFADKQDNGWILVSDTDEHFPIEALSKLKDVIRIAEFQGYNGIKIRKFDIITEDNSENIVSTKLTNLYKPLLFKYHPSIYYEGTVHETLKGSIIWKEIDLIYQYIYSQKKICEKSVENYFIANSSSQKWKEFRNLCTKNNILKFDEFHKLYKEGTLPKDIEYWIYSNRNYKEDHERIDNIELRYMAKFYFEILHPNKDIAI